MNKAEIDLHLKNAAAIRIKDVCKAITMVEEAIQHTDEISYQEGNAQAWTQLAHYKMMQGNFDKALSISTQSYEKFHLLNNEAGTAEALYVKGNTYLKMGELHNGLKELVACLKIYEAIDDKKGQAKTCNSIGYVYKSFKDYKHALKHYDINLKISEELDDINGQSNAHNNIAQILFDQQQYEEGLATVNLGIPMKRATEDKRGLCSGLHTKGKLLAKLNKDEEALIALIESLEINEEMNDTYQMALCNMSIGAIYIHQNKTEQASNSINKAVILAEKIKAKEILYKCEHHLYTIAELENNPTNALIHFKQYHSIKEEVISQEKNLKVKNVQLEYQVELAEKMKSKNKELEAAHKELAEHHKSISDSIKYAERLQLAILPSEDEVMKHIPNNFIFFTPKDVVSGDFYWFEHVNGVSYIAAADCTGHGVPGALVSVVCSNALNRSVKEFKITEPAKILHKTRELVIETFAKSGEAVKDGMDISLCAISNNKVSYTGANNPLWIIRKTENLTTEEENERGTCSNNDFSLIEHKGCKQPIGLYHKMTDFSQTEIQLYEGDTLYMFTDGFPDQFGGPKGKKYKYRPFKKFLLQMNCSSLEDQKIKLANEFKTWKGDTEQTDDVCVIGVRV